MLLTQGLGGPAPSLLLYWEPPDCGVWCGAVYLGPHRGPARSPVGDTPGSTRISSQPSLGLHVEHGVGPTRLSAERTRAFLGRLAATQASVLNSGHGNTGREARHIQTHILMRNQNENIMTQNVY